MNKQVTTQRVTLTISSKSRRRGQTPTMAHAFWGQRELHEVTADSARQTLHAGVSQGDLKDEHTQKLDQVHVTQNITFVIVIKDMLLFLGPVSLPQLKDQMEKPLTPHCWIMVQVSNKLSY